MIAWTWTRESVDPEDILDAIHTIPVTNNRITLNLTWRWIPARRYLEWVRRSEEGCRRRLGHRVHGPRGTLGALG